MRRPIWWLGFLQALRAEFGNVTRAADRAGRHPSQVYRRMHTDPKCRMEFEATLSEIESEIASLCSTSRRRQGAA